MTPHKIKIPNGHQGVIALASDTATDKRLRYIVHFAPNRTNGRYEIERPWGRVVETHYDLISAVEAYNAIGEEPQR